MFWEQLSSHVLCLPPAEKGGEQEGWSSLGDLFSLLTLGHWWGGSAMHCGPPAKEWYLCDLVRIVPFCAFSPHRCGTTECVGSYSWGKTVSSESFIFRFSLSVYLVLELPLPGQKQWGVSSQPGRLGALFSGSGQENSGEEGRDALWF